MYMSRKVSNSAPLYIDHSCSAFHAVRFITFYIHVHVYHTYGLVYGTGKDVSFSGHKLHLCVCAKACNHTYIHCTLNVQCMYM